MPDCHANSFALEDFCKESHLIPVSRSWPSNLSLNLEDIERDFLYLRSVGCSGPAIHVSGPDNQHVRVQILWPPANQKGSLERINADLENSLHGHWASHSGQKAMRLFHEWWGQYLLLISVALSFQLKPIILYKRHYSCKIAKPFCSTALQYLTLWPILKVTRRGWLHAVYREHFFPLYLLNLFQSLTSCYNPLISPFHWFQHPNEK